MNLEGPNPNVEFRSLERLIGIKAGWSAEMEARARSGSARGRNTVDHKRLHQLSGNDKRGNYFSLESFLVLVCLTASLLLLPLILPPLPPPPFLLLLLPIGILVVLLVLAFMPSDVRRMLPPACKETAEV